MAKGEEKLTVKLCSMCVHLCKQRPDCTVISCRNFEKKDGQPKEKH